MTNSGEVDLLTSILTLNLTLIRISTRIAAVGIFKSLIRDPISGGSFKFLESRLAPNWKVLRINALGIASTLA